MRLVDITDIDGPAKLTDWQARLLLAIEVLRTNGKRAMLVVDGPALLLYRLENAGRYELDRVIAAED